jgi:hypothetical protein
MNDSSVNLLLLGESELDDFRPAVEFLRCHQAIGSVRMAADVSGLPQLLSDGNWNPDLIVVCEAWPDQFLESDVIEVLTLCPLARIVCCYGPWCDSAGRTRSVWPLAVRTPVVAARTRLSRELTMLAGRQSAARVLPLTASRGEIFEHDFGSSPAAVPSRTTARVISPDRRWREMLQAALVREGCRMVHETGSSEVHAVIYDTDPWGAGREAELRSIRASCPRARIIACVGFPRCDLDLCLRQAGADSTWFKLAPLQQLVDDLCGRMTTTADDADRKSSCQ